MNVPRQIKTLKIEILDPDVLREYSVAKLTNSSVQPENRPNGVFDIKLGSTTYLTPEEGEDEEGYLQEVYQEFGKWTLRNGGTLWWVFRVFQSLEVSFS